MWWYLWVGPWRVITVKWVMRVEPSRWDQCLYKEEKNQSYTHAGEEIREGQPFASQEEVPHQEPKYVVTLTSDLSLWGINVYLSHTVYHIWWWQPKLTKALALNRKSWPQLQSFLIDWVLSTEGNWGAYSNPKLREVSSLPKGLWFHIEYLGFKSLWPQSPKP